MRFKTILLAGSLFLQALCLTAQYPIPGNPLTQLWLAERAPKSFLALRSMKQPVAKSAVGIVERGGVPVLDSAILYSGYALGDSFPQQKSGFSYPAPNMAVQIDYAYLGGWQAQRRFTRVTDNIDRQIELLAEIYEPGSGIWIPESRLRSYPHGLSEVALDSLFAEAWDVQSESWVTTLYTETSYDQDDRPVLVASYINEDGFTFAILDELYYDANGDNYLTDQSVFEQGQWTLFAKVEREFVQHREIRNTTYGVPDPNTIFPITKVETSYDAAGNAIQIDNYASDFFTGEWTLNESTQQTFDQANRITSVTFEQFGNDAPPPSRTNYAYLNTDGEELSLEIYSEKDLDSQEWVILEKTYYYYGNTTAAAEIQNGETLVLTPNPTTGMVRLPAVVTDAHVQVLNANGQPVQAGRRVPVDGQLNLSDLPAGLYYISVQQGALRRTGAVVKQ